MHLQRGNRAASERYLRVVSLLMLLASLALSAACGGDDDEAGEAGANTDAGGDQAPSPDGEGQGEAGAATDAGGANDAPDPDDEPPSAGQGEAGQYNDPGGNTTTVDPIGGFGDGYIWSDRCTVYVTDRIDAGQYAELRSEIDCIVSDRTAPPEVVDYAFEVLEWLDHGADAGTAPG